MYPGLMCGQDSSWRYLQTPYNIPAVFPRLSACFLINLRIRLPLFNHISTDHTVKNTNLFRPGLDSPWHTSTGRCRYCHLISLRFSISPQFFCTFFSGRPSLSTIFQKLSPCQFSKFFKWKVFPDIFSEIFIPACAVHSECDRWMSPYAGFPIHHLQSPKERCTIRSESNNRPSMIKYKSFYIHPRTLCLFQVHPSDNLQLLLIYVRPPSSLPNSSPMDSLINECLLNLLYIF